jgi:hypothetical protein
MVMLYEGGLKKLTTTRYPVYPIMSYSVSRTGCVLGYVVRDDLPLGNYFNGATKQINNFKSFCEEKYTNRLKGAESQ